MRMMLARARAPFMGGHMSDQPQPTSAPSTAWWALSTEEALKQQGVSIEAGLSAAEVESRRAKFGPNKFADAPKEPRWQAFIRQYADPMQIVLLDRGHRLPVPARPVRHRRLPHRADAVQRLDGHEPGGQGLGGSVPRSRR